MKEQNVGQDINNNEENTITNPEEQRTAQIQEVTTDISTEVVTQNPIAESYNIECNGVKIKNETCSKIIGKISPLTFGIYLIHENPFVYQQNPKASPAHGAL